MKRPDWKFVKEHPLSVLIIVTFLIAILVVIAKFWSNIISLSLQIWQWFLVNIGTFLVSILGSMVAAVLFILLYEKSVWYKDAKYIKTELEKIRSHSASLMEILPDTISEKFTENLFEIHPETSKKLAEILSKQTQKWYRRHYKRVIVVNAEDIYKLRQIRKVKNSEKEAWEFEFQSNWEWVNDSKVTKYPLENFMIIVSPSDQEIESFLDAKTPQGLEDQREKFFEFIRKENIVRSIIPIILPLNPIVIDELFSVHELDIYLNKVPKVFSSDKLDKLEDLDEIKKELGVVGILRAYRLKKEDAATIPLEPNKNIRISFRGRISLLLDRDENGKCYGEFSFPPSDIIASEYAMTLIYPKTIKIQDNDKTLKILNEQCGKWFVYERSESTLIEDTHSIAAHLPKEFKPTSGEDAAKLVIKGPLTDLNRISMVWVAE